jgi:iron complex transport system substrate-binding protein
LARIVAGVSGAVMATAAVADPIAFTDMTGREVRLAKPAERIASIPIPLASTIIALDGSTRRLVGMNPLAKSAIEEGILGRIFPEAKAIPSDVTAPNFVPNVEALAATRPDLVIQWGNYGEAIVNPILNAGLTTMLVDYGTEAKGRQFMAITARAMGRDDRIEPLVAWRDAVEKDIAAKVAAIPAEQRPTVLYLARALSSLNAGGAGPAVYNDFYIKLAGGRNAAEELKATKPVSREQIATWDPEVILLNSFEPKLTVDFVYADPVLSLTRAAKAKRVYKMPLGGYRWDPPNQESPLTWMWLAKLLHPAVFTYDLRAEMKRAYKVLYGYTPTDADIDGILWMDQQGAAANYAAFKAK